MKAIYDVLKAQWSDGMYISLTDQYQMITTRAFLMAKRMEQVLATRPTVRYVNSKGTEMKLRLSGVRAISAKKAYLQLKYHFQNIAKIEGMSDKALNLRLQAVIKLFKDYLIAVIENKSEKEWNEQTCFNLSIKQYVSLVLNAKNTQGSRNLHDAQVMALLIKKQVNDLIQHCNDTIFNLNLSLYEKMETK